MHVAMLVRGSAAKFWLRRESDIVQFETRYSPMRWFKDWKGFTKGRAGYYMIVRFLVLIGFVLAAFYLPEECSIEYIILKLLLIFLVSGLILDIMIVNTSVAFITRNSKDPLRAAVFLVFAFFHLIEAFSVFYLLSSSSFTGQLKDSLIRAVYFSAITMTTLGHGDAYPRAGKWNAELLVVSEMLIGFYFVGLLIATIIGLWSNLPPRTSPKSLADLETL